MERMAMRVAVEKVGGSTLQQTVYDLICSGLTIGQVVSELPRLGYVGIDRRVIRELVEKARRRRGMRGQLARKRGLEQFDARKRSASGARAVMRDDGTRYGSLTEAAKAAGRHPSNLTDAINKNREVDGHFYKFANQGA